MTDEERALKIIVTKRVNITILIRHFEMKDDGPKEYNDHIIIRKNELSKKEFNFLRDVFKKHNLFEDLKVEKQELDDYLKQRGWKLCK